MLKEMNMAFTPGKPQGPGGTRPAGSPSSGPRPSTPGASRARPGRFGKPFLSRRKVCRFCSDKVEYIDFKNVTMLRNFITDRGKMLASRTTGVCTYHQRDLARA